MRVYIGIDSYSVQITTRDPELLARWLGEVFTGVDWQPSTYIRVQVWPTPVMNGKPQPDLDWIADSRIITRWARISSPQEFVDELQAQVNELKELT